MTDPWAPKVEPDRLAGPATEAGRRLFARLWAVSDYDTVSRIIATVQTDILAIEVEARAAERAAIRVALEKEFFKWPSGQDYYRDVLSLLDAREHSRG